MRLYVLMPNNRLVIIPCLVLVMLIVTMSAYAQAASTPWQRIKGSAVDITIGTQGTVAAVDKGGRVYLYDHGDEGWQPIGKRMSRITAGNDGTLWGVDNSGQLRHFSGTVWNAVGAGAVDVTTGPDGRIYVTTNTNSIAAYDPKQQSWSQINGSAKRLAVDAQGMIWSISPSGAIARRLDDAWIGIAGKASDIAADDTGRVVIVGQDGKLYEWQEDLASWRILADISTASAVAAGDGQIWRADGEGRIFAQGITELHRNKAQGIVTSENGGGSVDPQTVADTSPIVFERVPSATKLADLAIGQDGSVYGLTASGAIKRWSNTEQRFNEFPGQVDRLAVRDNGLPIAVGTQGNLVQHDGEAWRLVNLNLRLIDLALYEDERILVLDNREQAAKLSEARTSYTQLSKKGQQIAAQNDGSFWVIDSVNRLFRCDPKGACEQQAFKAEDISIGPGGSVFIVDTNASLRRFNRKDGSFEIIRQGDTARVAAGPNDRPWIVNNAGLAYAANFFERDESSDRRLALKTEATAEVTKSQTATINNSGVQIVQSVSFSAVNIPTTAPGYTNLGSGLLDITSGRDDIVLATGFSDPCVEGSGRNWLYDPLSRSFKHLDYLNRINLLAAVAGETLSAADLSAIGLSASDTKPPTTAPDIQALYMQWQEDCTIPVLITYASSVFTDAGKVASNDYQNAVFDSAFVVKSSADIDVAANEVVVQVDGINTLRFFKPGDVKDFSSRADMTFMRAGIGEDEDDLWVVNSANNVYEFMPSSDSFALRSINQDDQAQDIGVGHDGTVFIVNLSGVLKKWDPISKRFIKTNKSGVSRVAVDSRGNPIVANFPASQTVYFGR